MRKMAAMETTVIIGVLLAALVFLQMPLRASSWLYPVMRQVFQAKLNYDTRDMLRYETEHFIVKYEEADAGVVEMVARAAEEAYLPVTDHLGYTPKDKGLLIIYPDKSHLNQVFGWTSGESAMGVYYGGAIQVLSPRAWLRDGEAEREFIRTGPVLHEYTHLVFDYMTNGNYSRWFTEGLAQYMEYKINGYEWLTKDNKLDGRLYSMAEMEDHFDGLDNKALAYRQSLAAVRYIAETKGEDTLRNIITGLARGVSLQQAIAANMGMSYEEYDQAWRNWAVRQMNGLARME